MTRHVVCFSGGESSAKVAVLVARRFGIENLTLLNHDICGRVEDQDIKRFKREVAAFIGAPITYANMDGWEDLDQFDVCVKDRAFKPPTGPEICTSRLKTRPFLAWLEENIPDKDCVIYYGFDANETDRILRRSSIMGAQGYRTDYPLALWPEKMASITEIGVLPPNTYGVFKHGNCKGCLKAGLQHWYVIYCTEPEIWEKAKWAETEIGYSIHDGAYLEDLEEKFEIMRRNGVPATEHVPFQRFWASANKIVAFSQAGQTSLFAALVEPRKPCECVF
jgi:hypothetical protein